MSFRTLLALAIVLAFSSISNAATLYTSGDLVFQTQTDQSAWGSGNATQFGANKFLGVDVSGSTTVGGITGDVRSVTAPTNPLWYAWVTCKNTINVLCGSEPAKNNQTVTTDTRTGATVTATSSGKIGAEVGYSVDGGSVSANLKYDATAYVPDKGEVGVGETFNFNPMSDWVDGTLSSQSPTASAYINAYADLKLDVGAKGCVFLAGCIEAAGNVLDTGVQRQEVIGVTPTEIRFLDGLVPGVTASVPLADLTADLSVGVSATLTPSVTVDISKDDGSGNKSSVKLQTSIPVGASVDVASAGITFPEASGSAGLAGGNEINLHNQADFISADLDVDTLLPIVPPGGVNLSLGPLSVSLDAYDVKVGPRLDVFQDFKLTSDLFVDMTFDKQVLVQGVGMTDHWSGLWKNLPDFSVFERTVFTPVYSVVSQLTNSTGLTLGFDLTAEMFKLAASVDIGVVNLFNGQLGPLFSKTIPLGTDVARLSIFDKSFALNGFNTVAGKSFVVDPTARVPSVPVPSSVALMLGGIGLFGIVRRRRPRVTVA